MMRCEFLADVELCEEGLEHGGRLPLHHYSVKFCGRVRVLVPGISVPEVDGKFSGSAVGVSLVWVMEDLVEDVWTGIRDDGGERCHGIMVGHVFICSTLPLFLFAEQHYLVRSLQRTSQR